MTLDALLAPRSIAVVGASERGAGARVRESLTRLDFPGPLYLVNPRHDTVAGQRCYSSMQAIGEPVDLAVLAISPRRVLPALEDCAGAGIPAAIVFAAGFAETGSEGAKAQAQLADLAQLHGMSILGPNCMGYVRPHARRAVYLDHLWRAPPAGPVALITQSGSVGVGALNHTGTLGLSAMISVGNEAAVTAADVIDWLVTDEQTRAIALFIEDTSRAHTVLESANRAIDAGKPVVACRAGRSEAGARAAQTHTDALATPDRALRAVLRANGIVLVDDLDELWAAAEILATGRPAGTQLAGVTVSGGHVSLMHDLAAGVGLSFPEPEAAQANSLEAALGEPRALHNPVDAWADADVAGGFDRVVRALQKDRGHQGVVAIVDAPADPPTSDPELSLQFARSVAEAAQNDDRLWVMATSTVASDDPRITELARAAGCPRINGLHTALATISNIAASRHAHRPLHPEPPVASSIQLPLTEAEGYGLLRSYGIHTPEFRVCVDKNSAVEAAEEIGYPVTIKAHRPGLLHKSAVGAVELGLNDPAALLDAYSRIIAKFADGTEILVARQAGDGVDVLVGAQYFPQLGPVVLIGSGGTLTELIDDIAIVPVPADSTAIRAALADTKAYKLLTSRVGIEAPGYAQLIRTIEAAGDLILSAMPGSSVDINPVRVSRENAIALDFAATTTQ